MNQLAVRNSFSVVPQVSSEMQYLMPQQIDVLTSTFQGWYDSSASPNTRRIRGRYWLTYLALRYSGARIGEVLRIDETKDIDFRAGEIKMVTLKRHSKDMRGKRKRKSEPLRIIPVPQRVMTEIGTYLAEFPQQRGKIFGLDQGNFRRKFAAIASDAGIPEPLRHPHVMRHSFAIELLRSGVPVTGVQGLLGHTSLNTTALYLKLSNHETRQIMQNVGLL